MKNIYPYIKDSNKYYGSYEVVISQGVVIPCYNYATAVSIIKSIIREKNEST